MWFLVGMECIVCNQFYLQYVVEGLLVVVILYYVLLFVIVVFKVLYVMNLLVDFELVEGLLIVLVVFVVIYIMWCMCVQLVWFEVVYDGVFVQVVVLKQVSQIINDILK